MKRPFSILITVVATLLVGCGASTTPLAPGPVTDAKALVGTWEITEGYIQYNEDGSFRYSIRQENLTERPSVIGEYWFENGQYFEKEAEAHNVPSCGNWSAGVYEVELLENGNLYFTRVVDHCEARASATTGEHKRIE